jgi:uncharacterized delta-60 repeat protein
MSRRTSRTLIDSLESRTLMAFGDRIDAFGVAGSVALSATMSDPREVVVDSKGRFVVGGTGSILRVSPAGVVDSTFGTSGRIAVPAAYIDHALGPTGLIYALVTASSGTVLVRYTQNGKLDSTWATGGTALVTSDKSFQPKALTIAADGKPVVAGVVSTDGGDGSATRVYRLLATGGADKAFDADGYADLKLASSTFLTPVVQDAIADVRVVSGKVIVVGASRDWAPSTYDESTGNYVPSVYGNLYVASARLTANGALDTTYGSRGIARQVAAESYEGSFASVGAIDAAGNVVAGTGRRDTSAWTGADRYSPVVAKFSASGAKTYLAVATADVALHGPQDAVLLSDGRAIVIGAGVDGLLVTQELSTTGAFKQFTFARDADATTPDMNSSTSAAIAAAPDGKLIIAGYRLDDSRAGLMKVDVAASSTTPGAFANARANQLARDAQGGLHLAYYDVVTTKLTYAYRDPSGKWGAPVVVDGNPLSGSQLSIDIDSKNRPGIAYLDAKNSDLKLATFNGTAWTIRTVESTGSVGFDPSFQFTDDDSYAVTYYNKTRGDLRYALYKSGAWAIEDVETDGDTGRRSVLAVNPQTRKFGIAYFKQSTNEVRFAFRNAQKRWTSERIATTKAGADYVSLDFSVYGSPVVAWFDMDKADLKVATRNTEDTAVAGVWTASTVASAGTVGKYARVRTNYWGGWSIVAWDQTNDQLVLYEGSAAPVTVLTGGGQYASFVFGDSQIDVAAFEATKAAVRVSAIY